MYTDRDELNGLSGSIIGCAFTVYNALGVGFLEKLYENALVHELHKYDFAVARQRGVAVLYDGIIIGEYFADLLVEETILVELKAVKALGEAHRAQCLNYLRATGLKLGLLFNFGSPRLEIKRIINDR